MHEQEASLDNTAAANAPTRGPAQVPLDLDLRPERRRGRPPVDPAVRKAAENAGRRIRQRRRALGLTKDALGARIGVDALTIAKWERGFGPASQAAYLEAVAQALEVAPDVITRASEGDAPVAMASVANMSAAEREQLAQRARNRRRSIGLTSSVAAELAGMNEVRFRAAERALPSYLTVAEQAGWERALQAPPGWLLDAQMQAPEPEHRPLVAQPPAGAATAAGEILAVAQALVCARPGGQHIPVEQLSVEQQRNVLLIAARFGVEGPEVATLEAVGERFGLTRERVRQIVDRELERARFVQPVTPTIDSLCQQVREQLPADVAVLDDRLRNALGARLSIEDLARFCAEVLGKPLCQVLLSPPGLRWARGPFAVAGHPHELDDARTVVDTTLSTIRSTGAASIDFVAGAVSRETGRPMSVRTAEGILRAIPTFEWLSLDDGWFWLGPDEPARNRLLAACRKVLAVARERVDVEDLLQAFARGRRPYYEDGQRARPYLQEPPMDIVRQVLRRVEWAECVQSDDFRLADGIEWVRPPSELLRELLSDAELAIVEVMAEQGGCAARYTLHQALVATGRVKQITLGVALQDSPIIRRLDVGIFALRGWPVRLQALERAQAAVGGPANGWGGRYREIAPEERLNCEQMMTEFRLRQSVFELPGRMKESLPAGDYTVADFAEPVTIVHEPRGSRLVGFVRQLRRVHPLDAGDRVRIRVDPDARRIDYTLNEPEVDAEGAPASAAPSRGQYPGTQY